MLDHADSSYRHAAMKAIDRIVKDSEDKVAISKIAMQNDNSDVREWAMRQLIASLEDRRLRDGITKVFVRMGARTVEPLISALRQENPLVRSGAAMTLGKMTDTRAVLPLVATLEDVDANVRMAAAASLGQLEDRRGLDPLLKALQDRVAAVRIAAADSLRFHLIKSDDTQIVAQLTGFLSDSEESVRVSMVEILTRIADLSALDPLVAALKDRSRDVRGLAALALRRLATRGRYNLCSMRILSLVVIPMSLRMFV